MKSIKSLIGIGAFAFLLLGIPAIASAQYGGQYDPWGRNGQNDPYGRNGGYNNGQYGRYGDMRSTVRELKSLAGQFTRQLDRDLDNSRYNGTRREDEINRMANDFRNAVNRISESNNNYGRRDDRTERALQLGSELERRMSRVGVSYQAQNIWQRIRYDLQVLGNGYYTNNRGRNNNGGWNNGGTWNNGRLPSWWPF